MKKLNRSSKGKNLSKRKTQTGKAKAKVAAKSTRTQGAQMNKPVPVPAHFDLTLKPGQTIYQALQERFPNNALFDCAETHFWIGNTDNRASYDGDYFTAERLTDERGQEFIHLTADSHTEDDTLPVPEAAKTVLGCGSTEEVAV